jgi:uncharacterized protein YutE (UPF0331/DUF86 family)
VSKPKEIEELRKKVIRSRNLYVDEIYKYFSKEKISRSLTSKNNYYLQFLEDLREYFENKLKGEIWK